MRLQPIGSPVSFVVSLAILFAALTAGAALPVAPTNVQAFVIASDRVYLVWTDASADEAGFQVDIGTVASGIFTPHTLRTSTSTESTQTGESLDLVSRTDTVSYQLAAGTQYQARVRAYNYLGANNSLQYSTASTTVTFTTQSPAAFNVPTNLQVQSYQATHIRLGWTDNSTMEDGYGYNFSINGTGQSGLFGLSNINGVTADFEAIGSTTISPGTTYGIQVWGHRFFGGATSFTGGSTSANPLVSVTTLSALTFDPPSNFAGTRSGDAGFNLSWTDNSTTEDQFDIQFREGTTGSMSLLSSIPWNITTTNLGGAVGKPNTTYQFQVRATKTTGGTTSSTIWVGAPLSVTTTFSAPSGLVATAPDETHVNLAWTDNSNAEGNYEVQYFDSGLNAFTNYNYYSANTTTVTNIPTGSTPVTLRFRVRATYGSGPDIFSAFSDEATVSTFRGPTSLTATPVNETTVNFAWTDNSSLESKYLVLGRNVGSTQWTLLATTAANATSKSVTDLPPGATLEFAVLAAVTSSPNDIESPLSNIVTASTPFLAPTSFAASVASDRQINLSWTDNSAVETAYIILCKRSTASQYRTCAILSANSTSFQAKAEDKDFEFPFAPDITYDFQVLAANGSAQSAAASVSGRTKDGTSSDLSPSMFVGEAFNHAFTFTTGQGTIASSQIVGGLPPGVSYDSNTRSLSGTPTARGSFTPTLQVNWSNGWTGSHKLHLRPIYRPGPPVATGSIASQTLTLGGTASVSIPLASLASDMDTESAIRLDIPASDGTPSGRSIVVILNDSTTPQTVANFRAYLNNSANGYTGSIFHRLVPNFILQGGAYKSSSASGAPSNAFVSVPKLSAVVNEPGISNVPGTIAMAKVAGNPDSATTDFFFNLADNSGNLDFQNEGFTVFGRVASSSLALLTGTINSLPLPPSTSSYAVTVDGSSTTFTALPTNTTASTAPADIDSAMLLRIDTVASTVPVLTFSAVSSAPAVVTAVVSGTSLTLNAVGAGAANVSVQATDLDGNTLASPLNFAVEVSQTFPAWAAGQALPPGQDAPGADVDHDGGSNLVEFALLTDPQSSDQRAQAAAGIDGGMGTITFKLRKFTTLMYSVEASSDLSAWTTLWTQADGFSTPNVVSAVDEPDHTLVTVRDTTAAAGGAPRFLRLKIILPAL